MSLHEDAFSVLRSCEGVSHQRRWAVTRLLTEGDDLFELGAFAVIFNDQERVLLCRRRDYDVWNLPGGGVESREMPTEAVIREVEEETALTVEIERLVGVYGKTDKDELVFTFLCRPVGGHLSITDESKECRYFKMEDIPINTIPKHVERIHDAAKPGSHPVFRRQTAPSTGEMLRKMIG
jgi:ADP-ribose pyrophosphatase YjhB (NUDIX family)